MNDLQKLPKNYPGVFNEHGRKGYSLGRKFVIETGIDAKLQPDMRTFMSSEKDNFFFPFKDGEIIFSYSINGLIDVLYNRKIVDSWRDIKKDQKLELMHVIKRLCRKDYRGF